MTLPDFIIIGAQKCGTTALRSMLKKHPGVHMAKGPKIGIEPHYFDREYFRGISWYSRLFRNGLLNGEKTPCYVAVPHAMIRMYRQVPDAKLIVVLRDPVIRYLSGHRHRNKMSRDHKTLKQFFRHGTDALWRGCYATQLDLVFSLFPRDRVLVVFSEEMRARTSRVLDEVQQWLGLSPVRLTNSPSEDRVIKNEEIGRKLSRFYEPHNARLFEMLGQPDAMLGWTGHVVCRKKKPVPVLQEV
jgi:hypothetical protein